MGKIRCLFIFLDFGRFCVGFGTLKMCEADLGCFALPCLFLAGVDLCLLPLIDALIKSFANNCLWLYALILVVTE